MPQAGGPDLLKQLRKYGQPRKTKASLQARTLKPPQLRPQCLKPDVSICPPMPHLAMIATVNISQLDVFKVLIDLILEVLDIDMRVKLGF